tara:strand:+ start:57 stop:188 length:132 start_codon:yes stop_codon:yes gene_type:complete
MNPFNKIEHSFTILPRLLAENIPTMADIAEHALFQTQKLFDAI